MSESTSISDIRKQLEERRNRAFEEVQQCEKALAGIALASNLLGTPGSNGNSINRRSRSGEHIVPPELDKAIRNVVQLIHGHFSMKALREHLRIEGFKKPEIGHPVA